MTTVTAVVQPSSTSSMVEGVGELHQVGTASAVVGGVGEGVGAAPPEGTAAAVVMGGVGEGVGAAPPVEAVPVVVAVPAEDRRI